MSWAGVRIGEGFAGSGTATAHVNVVLGDRSGSIGQAWATALAAPSPGHTPFLVVARPGLPVKPFTLFVSKATVTGGDHATVTWGAAQAGVAAGVVEAVRQGTVPLHVAEDAVMISAVWVDPGVTAAEADAVFSNNRAAVLAALEAAGSGRPSTEELLADPGGIWNPYYRP